MTLSRFSFPRSTRLTFFIVNILVYGSVSLRWILEFVEQAHPLTALLSMMLGLYGLLMVLKELQSGANSLWTQIYLGIQTVLIFSAALLFYELDFFALLFLPLTMQAVLALEQKTSRRWVGLFIVTVIVGQITQFGGLESLPFSMLYVAGILAVGLLIESTLKSEASNRRSEALLAELKEAHEQLKAYSQQAEQLAIVEERNRLARELHDSVAQTLYGLNLRTEAAYRKLQAGQTEGLADYLREFQESTQHTLQETRLLIHELRPDILSKEGLKTALLARLENVERRSGMELKLELEEVTDLKPEVESSLYRIALEALNNIMKHAQATEIQVRLAQMETAVLLTIEDNGIGLPEKITSGHGLGLQGMRERAAQIGAEISINGRAGEGAIVSVEVAR